jgi:hypothetical protein
MFLRRYLRNPLPSLENDFIPLACASEPKEHGDEWKISNTRAAVKFVALALVAVGNDVVPYGWSTNDRGEVGQ